MHNHDHAHNPSSSERITWAFALNAAFTVVELIGGLLTNSTAILADAVHDLGDTLAIGTAWVLERLAGREADSRYTYGYRRLSLFGALFNAVVLVAGSVLVLYTALPRLLEPSMPHPEGMLGLALLGIAVNGAAVWKLRGGQTQNEKVLNWHLWEDVLGWVAVLVVSILLLFFDWPILDPLLAIGFTLFILVNVLRLLRQTLHLFFQGAPGEGLQAQLREALLQLPEVAGVHHDHVWSLDGEHHVYTAHLQLAESLPAAAQVDLKGRIAVRLQPFGLTHTTIELELPEEACRDTSATLGPGAGHPGHRH